MHLKLMKLSQAEVVKCRSLMYVTHKITLGLRCKQRRVPLLLEETQEKFRAREILKVLSTESYRADSRIRLARTDGEYPSPFLLPTAI